jgi:diguanylate cyclase (GGDEF)-like protein
MGHRRVPLLHRALVAVGVAFVGAGIYGGLGPVRAAVREELDEELSAIAEEQALILEGRLDRARTDAQLIAREGALGELVALDDFAGVRPLDQRPQVIEATGVLEYLGAIYPASIGEICLIRRDGVEATRVVFGEAVPYSMLSDDESQAVFFEPTFAMRAGQVYLAPPYLSPDTGEWVVSASSPLPGDGAEAPGIVHFEMGLNALRDRLVESDHVTLVVDRRTGAPVIDSRHPVDPEAELSVDAIDGWSDRDERGAFALGGRSAMSQDLFDFGFNASEWTVVVVAGSDLSPWAGFSRAPITGIVMGLLVSVVAWRALIESRRRTNEALTDELTGLGNRRSLRAALAEALDDRARGGVALALVDLDHFKEVNDTLGHQWGDQLLMVVAARLQASLRSSDRVYRLGGDEFAIVMAPVPDGAAAVVIAERAVASVTRPALVGGVNVMVSASVGVAVAPDDGADSETLLRRADVAMYEAKRSREPVVAYDTSIDPYRPERLALVQELREAVSRGSLEMWFQPIVEPVTDRWSAMEALLRWPGRNMPIEEVIRVAEANGLMGPITDLVLSRSLQQVAEWGEMGIHMSVSINVSVANLLEPDLVERISVALAVSGVSPAMLSIEVTETAVMSDRARACQVIEQIGTLGVAVGIDDYGSGNAGLSYLRELPVRFLKIDRMFVQHLLDNPTDAAIVRSTVDLGHSLGLYVVAEGVETPEVGNALAAAGCDLVQGYLFGRPAPAAQWLEALQGQAAVRRPAGR